MNLKKRYFSLTSDDDSDSLGWIEKSIAALVIVAIVKWLWPNVIPFEYFELWRPSGTILEWLEAGAPVLIWGLAASVVLACFIEHPFYVKVDAEAHLVDGIKRSFRAGILEEIAFRWILFMLAIVSVKLGNFLFFGWLGFGIVEWVQVNLTGPIANWTTLQYLKPQLLTPGTWFIGAALLSTNAFFRDGHKYLGPLGYVNSWFVGMYLFWITFKFGLPAAILIHVVYDLIVFTVRYVGMVIERRRDAPTPRFR